MTAMLTSQLTPHLNGAGKVTGWWTETADGKVAAFVPGEDCSPAYIGDFPHRPAAQSAILDHEEEGDIRRMHRESMLRAEAERLDRQITTLRKKVARLTKEHEKVEDFFDRKMVRYEIIRCEEEIRVKELLLAHSGLHTHLG